MDLETVVARVAGAVSATGAIDPVAVRFLLSHYAGTGSEELSAIVGEALARALQQYAAAAPGERAEWLLLFADAAIWSDDERVRDAAADLLASSDHRDAAAIEAALGAASALGDGVRISSAVDDLERLIAHGYEPGDGVAAADQFAVASALLTAYEVTGRLPYAMLADELVQTSRRRGEPHVDGERGCRAVRVLCRLATLHADEAYVAAAVVAPGADYRADSGRLLEAYAPRVLDSPRVAALYGLALAHWLRLH